MTQGFLPTYLTYLPAHLLAYLPTCLPTYLADYILLLLLLPPTPTAITTATANSSSGCTRLVSFFQMLADQMNARLARNRPLRPLSIEFDDQVISD